jgi:ATP phosphoribosyltransferase
LVFDAIVDIVSSGGTLFKKQLERGRVIYKSETAFEMVSQSNFRCSKN